MYRKSIGARMTQSFEEYMQKARMPPMHAISGDLWEATFGQMMLLAEKEAATFVEYIDQKPLHTPSFVYEREDLLSQIKQKAQLFIATTYTNIVIEDYLTRSKNHLWAEIVVFLTDAHAADNHLFVLPSKSIGHEVSQMFAKVDNLPEYDDLWQQTGKLTGTFNRMPRQVKMLPGFMKRYKAKLASLLTLLERFELFESELNKLQNMTMEIYAVLQYLVQSFSDEIVIHSEQPLDADAMALFLAEFGSNQPITAENFTADSNAEMDGATMARNMIEAMNIDPKQLQILLDEDMSSDLFRTTIDTIAMGHATRLAPQLFDPSKSIAGNTGSAMVFGAAVAIHGNNTMEYPRENFGDPFSWTTNLVLAIALSLLFSLIVFRSLSRQAKTQLESEGTSVQVKEPKNSQYALVRLILGSDSMLVSARCAVFAACNGVSLYVPYVYQNFPEIYRSLPLGGSNWIMTSLNNVMVVIKPTFAREYVALVGKYIARLVDNFYGATVPGSLTKAGIEATLGNYTTNVWAYAHMTLVHTKRQELAPNISMVLRLGGAANLSATIPEFVRRWKNMSYDAFATFGVGSFAILYKLLQVIPQLISYQLIAKLQKELFTHVISSTVGDVAHETVKLVLNFADMLEPTSWLRTAAEGALGGLSTMFQDQTSAWITAGTIASGGIAGMMIVSMALRKLGLPLRINTQPNLEFVHDVSPDFGLGRFARRTFATLEVYAVPATFYAAVMTGIMSNLYINSILSVQLSSLLSTVLVSDIILQLTYDRRNVTWLEYGALQTIYYNPITGLSFLLLSKVLPVVTSKRVVVRGSDIRTAVTRRADVTLTTEINELIEQVIAVMTPALPQTTINRGDQTSLVQFLKTIQTVLVNSKRRFTPEFDPTVHPVGYFPKLEHWMVNNSEYEMARICEACLEEISILDPNELNPIWDISRSTLSGIASRSGIPEEIFTSVMCGIITRTVSALNYVPLLGQVIATTLKGTYNGLQLVVPRNLQDQNVTAMRLVEYIEQQFCFQVSAVRPRSFTDVLDIIGCCQPFVWISTDRRELYPANVNALLKKTVKDYTDQLGETVANPSTASSSLIANLESKVKRLRSTDMNTIVEEKDTLFGELVKKASVSLKQSPSDIMKTRFLSEINWTVFDEAMTEITLTRVEFSRFKMTLLLNNLLAYNQKEIESIQSHLSAIPDVSDAQLKSKNQFQSAIDCIEILRAWFAKNCDTAQLIFSTQLQTIANEFDKEPQDVLTATNPLRLAFVRTTKLDSKVAILLDDFLTFYLVKWFTTILLINNLASNTPINSLLPFRSTFDIYNFVFKFIVWPMLTNDLDKRGRLVACVCQS
jgi:hypothetical protein